ncbi:MAG: MATE family efflux transporter [Firmicutes bacterium]|nr:MATE family efflux transporter [Bacillota bacterium]
MDLTIPMMLAQLLNVGYNIIDRFFIGRIPGEATLSMTALGVCMPIITLASAFAYLCGMGGSPLFSMERGRGDKEEAAYVLGNSFALLMYMGLTLTVVGLIFRRPMLYLFGASDETYAMAETYLSIYLLGSVFVMITLGMNSFINAQGFGRTGMIAVGIGAVVNTILDPILIFGLDLGVIGAAIATVVAQFCAALWTFRFLTGPKALVRLERKYMKLKLRRIRRISVLGITGFTMSATNGLVQISFNTNLQMFGGDPYVGVMTIINTVREVITLPALALTDSAQPMISFNYGAKNYGRIKTAIKFMCIATICYTLFMWFIVHGFPQVFIGMFSKDPEQFALGIPAMRTYYFGFFMMSLQFSAQTVFVALGKAKKGIFFSLFRKVIIVVPLTFILPRVGFGVMGTFAAEPVSNFVGGLACFTTMMLTVWPELNRGEKEQKEKEQQS